MSEYYCKYIKYKNKYLKLRTQTGGGFTESEYTNLFSTLPEEFMNISETVKSNYIEIMTELIKVLNMDGISLYDLVSNNYKLVPDELKTIYRLDDLEIYKDTEYKIDFVQIRHEIITYGLKEKKNLDKSNIIVPILILDSTKIVFLGLISMAEKLRDLNIIQILNNKLCYFSNIVEQTIYQTDYRVNVRIKHNQLKIYMISDTIMGRIGNNLTALLSSVYKLKNESKLVDDSKPFFIVANSWECNIYDGQAKVVNKFGVGTETGMVAMFPNLSKTFYYTDVYNNKTDLFNGFTKNSSNPFIQDFIKNILFPFIPPEDKDMTNIRPGNIIHLHLRFSDYCVNRFEITDFNYYYDAIANIKQENATEPFNIVIFCPPEDKIFGCLLQLYLQYAFENINIFFDDIYVYRSKFSINYIMSNYCDYLILSNSTFSLLSIALCEAKKLKKCYSPYRTTRYLYGTITEDELYFLPKKINNSKITTSFFQCKTSTEFEFEIYCYHLASANKEYFPSAKIEAYIEQLGYFILEHYSSRFFNDTTTTADITKLKDDTVKFKTRLEKKSIEELLDSLRIFGFVKKEKFIIKS